MSLFLTDFLYLFSGLTISLQQFFLIKMTLYPSQHPNQTVHYTSPSNFSTQIMHKRSQKNIHAFPHTQQLNPHEFPNKVPKHISSQDSKIAQIRKRTLQQFKHVISKPLARSYNPGFEQEISKQYQQFGLNSSHSLSQQQLELIHREE